MSGKYFPFCKCFLAVNKVNYNVSKLINYHISKLSFYHCIYIVENHNTICMFCHYMKLGYKLGA